jgi:hypothetical protein
MNSLMAEISNRKSIYESFESAYGSSLDELEIQWKNELGAQEISENQLGKKQENLTRDNSIGSCNGGAMKFEIYNFLLLFCVYFVKRLYITYRKRNKNGLL